MPTAEEVLKQVDQSIDDIVSERSYWEAQLMLAKAKVAVCNRALAECDKSLARFEGIKTELLVLMD